MNPEPTVAGFIHTVIRSTGEMTVQVSRKDVRVRILGIRLVFELLGVDTHRPALLVNVQPHKDIFIGKVQLRLGAHHRPPFALTTLSSIA